VQGQVLDLHTDHFRPLTCEGIIGCCFAWRIHPSTRQAPAHGGGQASGQPGQPGRTRAKVESGFAPKPFFFQIIVDILVLSPFCGCLVRVSRANLLLDGRTAGGKGSLRAEYIPAHGAQVFERAQCCSLAVSISCQDAHKSGWQAEKYHRLHTQPPNSDEGANGAGLVSDVTSLGEYLCRKAPDAEISEA
jgi:hypothetical protein